MPSKKKEEIEEGKSIDASQNVIGSLLKNNREDHYNFEETVYSKTPSSSLILNAALSGGLSCGISRFCGSNRGGKTSCALNFLKNFLDDTTKDRRGLYIKAEGRLSPEMQKMSGVTFVTDYNDWVSGTALIIDTNIFELTFDILRSLLVNNPSKITYFFIIDSLDCLIRREDAQKAADVSGQVAGGALLTSVFLKKVSVAMNKFGHYCLFISQLRSQIKLNPYEKAVPQQGGSSGGFGIQHACDWVLQFEERFKGDLIYENDDEKGKIIGHWCKVKIIKSNNESNNTEIRYPIRYKQIGGRSVFREKECLDLLLSWSLLNRSGAWFAFEESFLTELHEAGFNVEPKYQGLKNVYKLLDDSPELVDFLVSKFSNLI